MLMKFFSTTFHTKSIMLLPIGPPGHGRIIFNFTHSVRPSEKLKTHCNTNVGNTSYNGPLAWKKWLSLAVAWWIILSSPDLFLIRRIHFIWSHLIGRAFSWSFLTYVGVLIKSIYSFDSWKIYLRLACNPFRKKMFLEVFSELHPFELLRCT